jgi:hypothetical protein
MANPIEKVRDFALKGWWQFLLVSSAVGVILAVSAHYLPADAQKTVVSYFNTNVVSSTTPVSLTTVQ